MVLYFDVFHHPLTRAELQRLVVPTDDADGRAALAAAVDQLAARGLIETREHWCFRPGRGDGVERRRGRARNAERMWPLAAMAAAFLARVPFVRGVLITGGMSKGSTAPGDDVDFLLLVEPGHVWTLKSLLQAARKSWPHPVRELFCTNYLLATDSPVVDDKNVFTAIELATAVPMYGRDECVRLLEQNAWAQRFVPGLGWSVDRARNARPAAHPAPARVVERGLGGTLGRTVERSAVRAWDRYWNRKYDWLEEDVRAQRFKRRDEIATNHLHDFQGYVLRELRQRQLAAGVDERLELELGGRPVGAHGLAGG